MTDPQILFLDEATLGLDVDGRRAFWSHVRTLPASGRTVFFTTHYMEEAEVADRIALIDGGRIVALDSPRALKARLGGGVIRLRDGRRCARPAKAWLQEHGFAPEDERAAASMLVYRPIRPPVSCPNSCAPCRCGSSGRKWTPRAWRTSS